MTQDFGEFKFKLGDRVYHTSTNQHEANPAIVLERSLIECVAGFARMYTVRGLGFCLDVLELELALYTDPIKI